jgi:hypothetical protein
MRLKNYLTEKRSHPELNPRESVIDVLKTFVDKPGYVFTMTELEKVGINPHYNFDTPLGVYFYILNKRNYWKVINDQDSFAASRQFFTIAKVNMSKVLNIQTYSPNQLKKDYIILKKKYNNPLGVTDEQWRNAAIESGFATGKPESTGKDSGRNMFFFTHNIGIYLAENGVLRKASYVWEHILRVDLGYWGVWDDGSGTIYPGEPSQFVAFNPNVYTIIKTYNNSKYLKTVKISSIDQLIDFYNKNKDIQSDTGLKSMLLSVLKDIYESNITVPKVDGNNRIEFVFDLNSFKRSIESHSVKEIAKMLDSIKSHDLYKTAYFINIIEPGIEDKKQIIDYAVSYMIEKFKQSPVMPELYPNFQKYGKEILTKFSDYLKKNKKKVVPF